MPSGPALRPGRTATTLGRNGAIASTLMVATRPRRRMKLRQSPDVEARVLIPGYEATFAWPFGGKKTVLKWHWVVDVEDRLFLRRGGEPVRWVRQIHSRGLLGLRDKQGISVVAVKAARDRIFLNDESTNYIDLTVSRLFQLFHCEVEFVFHFTK